MLGGNLEVELAGAGEIDDPAREGLRAAWQARHNTVLAAGGLHIIGTERHESRRIDNQLRGRSGRQGDPGSSRFYLSMEDNLMRIFGDPVRTQRLLKMAGMSEGEVIESGMLTRQIEKAQRKVESHNFDIRKNLLTFDDVQNDQRKVVYSQRTEIMGTPDLSAAIRGITADSVETLIDLYLPKQAAAGDWDLEGLAQAMPATSTRAWIRRPGSKKSRSSRSRPCASAWCGPWMRPTTDEEARFGAPVMRHIEKQAMLQKLDQHWREHLAGMDYLKQGIHLRGYAQKDPKFEFKREAFEMFAAMLERIKFETSSWIAHVQVRTQEEIDREEEERRARLMRALQAQHAEAGSLLTGAGAAESGAAAAGATPARSTRRRAWDWPAAGTGKSRGPSCAASARSDVTSPVRAVPGKKYKHCHGALSSVE